MIPIKTADEIERMRESCQIAGTVLARMCELVEEGVNTYDLDQAGRKIMQELGCTSACYNYKVGRKTYPAYTCISVNEEVVHGIGSLRRILNEGDNITLDVVIEYNGFLGDNARTLIVGEGTSEMKHLVTETEKSLFEGIDAARAGNRVGDISNAVQRYIEKRKLAIVRDFVGHGIGKTMHEEPQIPNFGKRGRGDLLRPGMTLAIEPMVNMGRPEVEILSDGWTAVTRDRKPAAHFEHTVLVTEGDPEILTKID